jgi:hypothetical protein
MSKLLMERNVPVSLGCENEKYWKQNSYGCAYSY